MFDYKPKYVGFNSNEDEGIKFFDVSLLEQLAAGTQENEYLGLWSPRVANSSQDEGLMARMLLEATKQRASSHSRNSGSVDITNTAAKTAREQIKVFYVFRRAFEDTSESLAFKWFFHPRGKAINTLMRKLVVNK